MAYKLHFVITVSRGKTSITVALAAAISLQNGTPLSAAYTL